jgi:2-keto-3-deoxy-L-rhamnonate aldolase RhmA
VNSAEAIAAVEGIDVLLIGPQDLSISLGCHGDFGHATFLDAAQTVVAAGQRHGKAIGMVEREAADFRRWFEMGMRFLVCSTDSHMLYSSASRNVQELRALAG